jgi:hypothetical protein
MASFFRGVPNYTPQFIGRTHYYTNDSPINRTADGSPDTYPQPEGTKFLADGVVLRSAEFNRALVAISNRIDAASLRNYIFNKSYTGTVVEFDLATYLENPQVTNLVVPDTLIGTGFYGQLFYSGTYIGVLNGDTTTRLTDADRNVASISTTAAAYSRGRLDVTSDVNIAVQVYPGMLIKLTTTITELAGYRLITWVFWDDDTSILSLGIGPSIDIASISDETGFRPDDCANLIWNVLSSYTVDIPDIDVETLDHDITIDLNILGSFFGPKSCDFTVDPNSTLLPTESVHMQTRVEGILVQYDKTLSLQLETRDDNAFLGTGAAHKLFSSIPIEYPDNVFGLHAKALFSVSETSPQIPLVSMGDSSLTITDVQLTSKTQIVDPNIPSPFIENDTGTVILLYSPSLGNIGTSVILSVDASQATNSTIVTISEIDFYSDPLNPDDYPVTDIQVTELTNVVLSATTASLKGLYAEGATINTLKAYASMNNATVTAIIPGTDTAGSGSMLIFPMHTVADRVVSNLKSYVTFTETVGSSIIFTGWTSFDYLFGGIILVESESSYGFALWAYPKTGSCTSVTLTYDATVDDTGSWEAGTCTFKYNGNTTLNDLDTALTSDSFQTVGSVVTGSIVLYNVLSNEGGAISWVDPFRYSVYIKTGVTFTVTFYTNFGYPYNWRLQNYDVSLKVTAPNATAGTIALKGGRVEVESGLFSFGPKEYS